MINSDFLTQKTGAKNKVEFGATLPQKTKETAKKDDESIFATANKETYKADSKYTPIDNKWVDDPKGLRDILTDSAVSSEIDVKGALGVNDVDLSEKNGEELFDMFKQFKEDYGDKNINYMRTNAALVELLAGADKDQVKDFMDQYKKEYGDEGYKKLGDQMMWASHTKIYGMVDEDKYKQFMETMKENKDYIPTGWGGGIGNGFTWA